MSAATFSASSPFRYLIPSLADLWRRTIAPSGGGVNPHDFALIFLRKRADSGFPKKEVPVKVEHILQTKGADVFAVSGATTVKDAVDLLGEKNIGAVVVKDERGGVTGIFSERDVVRRLKAEGAGVLSKSVSDCMTKNPFTCTLETSLDELMGVMTNRRIRHMPVIHEGKLAGIVSIGDVVKRKIDSAEREAAMLKEYIAS
jgi:CBS domain-containing protein